MFLGKVKGHVIATAKDPSISGQKLLVVEPLRVDYATSATNTASGFSVTGRAIVALDSIGAGEGQIVLITQGSSARLAEGCRNLPTDAVVVGIVDEAVVAGCKLA
ncbi:Carbon dioxide concentrating mechanism protein CcmL [Poriferisphaera corsica]|uniref:Carbon dioxide concentrating mechanism protein CcmL n=1 Tax=Poriferisphaera corsica TaxID=2528020 RepID=A0A517YUL6_9BACT|nr:EutN/CcmL family microcompartment protein [Poriferisphaera corsica]QDU33907.1 Carbon dioxide concentrating mechanism protein CcmL [Poriferisphaera corsica]